MSLHEAVAEAVDAGVREPAMAQALEMYERRGSAASGLVDCRC
ncbi:hypothetical protein [Streptomyces sp. F001]|nr:hypothetical protein [Streptomyces sp. F001]